MRWWNCCCLPTPLFRGPLSVSFCPLSLALPPSARSLRCGQSKHRVQSSQSQDLSEEEEGSALARRWWPGPGESGRGSRPLPPKRSIIPAPTGNSHLSEHVLAHSSARTWHKYLHDMGWHGRSYHKSFKLIIAHYTQHSQWPPRQTVAKERIMADSWPGSSYSYWDMGSFCHHVFKQNVIPAIRLSFLAALSRCCEKSSDWWSSRLLLYVPVFFFFLPT